MKLAVNTPIPLEFKAARETFKLQEQWGCQGCRLGFGSWRDTEIFCIQSGPGKARATQAVTSFSREFFPDILIDTGTCGGIGQNIKIGDVILGEKCFEFDIGGHGFPVKCIKEMELPSAFRFLPDEAGQALMSRAILIGKKMGLRVFNGIQASGEYLINSNILKKKLRDLFQAAGANWETAGIFISALRASLPGLSFRIVSDLGDAKALVDFRAHAAPLARELYRYIARLIDDDWFGEFQDRWSGIPPDLKAAMPKTVLP